jgi:hypothetical protein
MHRRSTLLALAYALTGLFCGGRAADVAHGDNGGDASAPPADATSPGEDNPDALAPPPPPPAPDAGAGGGRVSCGASSCTTPSQVCCPHLDGGTCVPAGAQPGSCEPVACDEASDCGPGLVCCYVGHHGCGFGSACAPTCADPSFEGQQLCSTDAECSTGSCAKRSCGGATLGTCQAGRCCF